MEALRAYRKTSDLPLPRRLKGYAGGFFKVLRPKLAAEVKAAPFRKSWTAQGKLIRNSHLVNAVATSDHALIRDFHRDYWSCPAADEYYVGFKDFHETLFLAHHQGIVAETASAIRKAGGDFRRLVEIGPGNGKLLEHFSRNLPEVSAFHGVDLNLEQVENNRRVYEGSAALNFHHADARQWVIEHAGPRSVFVTNGGVLEYFTKPELEKLFRHLAGTRRPCVVSITECIATDHDLKNETETFPYGIELSLSHNYPALLRDAGFTIEYIKERTTEPGESATTCRWLQAVAVAG